MASLIKNRRTTLERAEKFISKLYFTDVNLYGRLYPEHENVTSIWHYAAPGRISYDDAISSNYCPTKIGESFGPTWSTHWFRLDISLPERWLEQEVRLRWNSNSEALIWKNGDPIQGLSGELRQDYILSKACKQESLRQTIYIEMACNELLGAGDGLMIAPPKADKMFTLSQVEVAIFNRQVYDLILDLEILIDLAKELPEELPRSFEALYVANEVVNVITEGQEDCYKRARSITTKFLNEKNGDSQHSILAMGHCHIDTAWLWPYAETIRKCARSWSSTIQLMTDHPDFIFTCSQAQQFEWVKLHYPSLYGQIKHYVSNGQFIPVGGTWVEMDGNIPSGESFIRQFLYGQNFFEREFGNRCKEFWLPDTFGYSAQLPQIIKLAGINRFLTQKMSWSLVNKFPHNTFIWEGIDGSSVLTHFPPGDSYTMNITVSDVFKTVKNCKDKGRVKTSIMLFGHGDGGGGPTEDMLERQIRLRNVDGCPKVVMSTPDCFFSHIERDVPKLNRWIGELYLELHNGTYTSQAQLKFLNRRCEFLLRNVELLLCISPSVYPKEEMDRLWKVLLCNQFHDVLPGSSIEQVCKEAADYYKEILEMGQKLLKNSLTAIFGDGKDEEMTSCVINTLSWNRQEVVSLSSENSEPTKKRARANYQLSHNGQTLVYMKVPALGYCAAVDCCLPVADDFVIIQILEDGIVLMENSHLKAKLDQVGRLVSLKIQNTKREFVSDPINQFAIYDDVPLYWDAWDVMDYHLETRKLLLDCITAPRIVAEGPLRVSLEVTLKISNQSFIKQVISLDVNCPFLTCQTEVMWKESHKLLKVEFPVNILSRSTTYDIQFGHLERNNHFNTSWDWARFEVCGHKWADISEYGWGFAILNNCKYGYSCINNRLCLSLLRASKMPDLHADMGSHHFVYAIMPHKGDFQSAGVIHQAYNLNCPLLMASSQENVQPTSWFTSTNVAIIIEAVKKAEHHERSLVMRLYECFGSHCMTTLTTSLQIDSFQSCNILEDPLEVCKDWPATNELALDFTPFQIRSLLLNMK